MIQLFERLWLQIKGMRTLFLVPFIGYYGIIPLYVWVKSYSSDFSPLNAVEEMGYLLVPFLSTWWIYLILKEYIEGDGREVLLLGKHTFLGAVLFWIINSICYIPVLYLKVEDFWAIARYDLYVQLVIIAFFMGGFCYFLNYYTKSVTVSMLLVMLYSTISNYTFKDERFVKLFTPLQFTVLQEAPYDENYSSYFKFILAGLIFWILGVAKSRKME
nr:hypothetical protein [Eubacterium sp.]